MSSVVIWRDEATGVTASWNKQGRHSVFVPLRIDGHGICDGRNELGLAGALPWRVATAPELAKPLLRDFLMNGQGAALPPL